VGPNPTEPASLVYRFIGLHQYSTKQGSKIDTLGDIDSITHAQVTSDMTENNDAKEVQIPSKCVTSVASVTKPRIDDIPQESWNGRIKEVGPRIFGDIKYLGRLTKQGTFMVFQDGPKK
jgi:hypothetical protein